MALITIVIAAFTTQPIDYLLLAVTAVSTILVYTGKNLIALLHSDSPVGALSWVNLASGVFIAVGTAILESVGTYLIEGVILWDIVWKVVLASAFTYLGASFFAPRHSTAKVRGFVSPDAVRALKRSSLIVVLLFAIGIGASAQRKSLIDPVVVSDLKSGEKGFSDNMFLRFGATFTANTMKLGFDENGEFTGINSEFLSRAGVLIGLAHYVEKDGVAVNNYSLNGLIMTPTEGRSNLAVGATISAYNFSFGPGYDFIKDDPETLLKESAFKRNIFLMFNMQILF